MKAHKLTNKALVLSSCDVRQCHPETCCCDIGEAAIMDYVVDKKYGLSWEVVQWGQMDHLEKIVKAAKQFN